MLGIELKALCTLILNYAPRPGFHGFVLLLFFVFVRQGLILQPLHLPSSLRSSLASASLVLGLQARAAMPDASILSITMNVAY